MFHAVVHVGSGLNFVAVLHFWLVAFDGISFDCLLVVVVEIVAGVEVVAVAVAAAFDAGVFAVVAARLQLLLQTLLLVLQRQLQGLQYTRQSTEQFG